LQVLLGVPLGILAAVKRDRPADSAAQVAALLGQTAPTFFLGPLFMYALSYRAGLFPVSGYGKPGLDRLWHLFLPAFTLAVTGIAYYARLVRAEMIEVLEEDYIRTARAKGVPHRRVIFRHALRNALVPVVTLIGLDLGVLMGGAIVTEYIFGWPGLGREAVNGILNIDLPLVLGVVLLSALAILVANLLVDVAYALLDPRVRLE
jgi:peptide/nickel transport system permease protein